MHERTDRPDWSDELAVDHLLAGPAFYELIGLTAETCLAAPERVELHRQRIEESRTISEGSTLLGRLGLWGLRNALEISRHPREFDYDSRESDEEDGDYINADSAIMWPQGFSGELDPRIQNTIEAFGKSMLEEAFICLGEDAQDKVIEYQKAETKEEQLAVFEWLLGRINEIRKEKTNDDEEPEKDADDDSTFYHPARLSPKFIGRYPDIRAVPTCLGVSILAASFMEKAREPYLHAGVALSDADQARQEYIYMLRFVDEQAEELGVPLPDEMSERLKQSKYNTRKVLREDRGYHAAVLVKLKDNDWLQLDPNFSRNVQINNCDMATLLDECYEDLRLLGDLVPGTEMIIRDRMDSGNMFMEFTFLRSIRTSPSLEHINDYLKSAEDLTFKNLADQFIAPLFTAGEGDKKLQRLQEIVRLYLESFDDPDSPEEERFFEKVMRQVIESRVFPDAEKEGLDKCIARCCRDDSYRQRRAEDLRLAPLYFMTKITGMTTNSIISGETAAYHPRLEVGLPAYRIGASVLSDFAVYCGDELPPSFWLTYWPSHVAATEHIPPIGDPYRREPLLNNVLGLLDRSLLRYIKSYGIIDEYLEQEYETGGGDSDRK